MTTATKEYSADELSAHKTRDDLWLAIHGKGELVTAENSQFDLQC